MRADYEHDFYAWANEQSALLRAGKFAVADIANIATLGRSDKRDLVNRLTVLLLHLLKWQFQPSRRSRSWEIAIHDQRRKLASHLQDNPSLKGTLPDAIRDAFQCAAGQAELATKLPQAAFPQDCPYVSAQIMADEFWPGQKPGAAGITANRTF